MELWPTIARNVRRIGPWSALVIAVRVVCYFPWWGLRRLFVASAQPHVTRQPW